MNNIKSEKKILSQIVKARDAIKKKYRLFQSNKLGFEKAMGETFKPITEPLEKLVDINQKQKQKNDLNRQSENNEDDISNSSTIREDEIENDEFDTASEEETEKAEEREYSNPLYEKYFNLSSRSQDNVYGVRKEQDGTFKIGDSPITFTDKYIIVQKINFPVTEGFLELMFTSQPNANLITSDDLRNYRKIVEMTNAFRKDYNEENPVRRSRSNKYKYYIAPFFDQSLDKRKSSVEGSGVRLPQFKLGRKNTLTDYVYWDDPNELVDRLRLLIAELSAGNQSHTNEIHSIIEELRESGYIY